MPRAEIERDHPLADIVGSDQVGVARLPAEQQARARVVAPQVEQQRRLRPPALDDPRPVLGPVQAPPLLPPQGRGRARFRAAPSPRASSAPTGGAAPGEPPFSSSNISRQLPLIATV